MAHATTLDRRFATPSARAIFAAILVVAVTTMIVLAALLIPTSGAPAEVQPRSEAVLEAGRAWQRQYESMSGLEARRERHADAVLQSGRDWEEIQKQITGE